MRLKRFSSVRSLLRLWPSGPPLRLASRRLGATMDEATERLLREAEIAAERRAGVVRIVVAVLLLATIYLVSGDLPAQALGVAPQIWVAKVTLVLFGLVGVVSSWAASRRLAARWLPIATATADAALIFANLLYIHEASGIEGRYFAAFPVIWVVPIALAASAIHYRPRLQAYLAILYTTGIIAIAALAGGADEGRDAVAALPLQFGWPPNVIRLTTMVLAALILIVVARQGRVLLDRAVRETTLRHNLTRYLPRELAPILSEEGFASLRAGRRLEAVLLFVDIRDSSALAERMDAAQLAVFISAFRRRVMRAAAEHGGVVDKFLGDGALILFGVPTDRDSDAARALACGRRLLDLVERWNRKRRFDPPVRVGIGCHCGEVFCGVVGDEARLEFTVLGEPVNITARIEQTTKTLDQPFIASRDVVEAAGECEDWQDVAEAPLRGITRTVRLMVPKA